MYFEHNFIVKKSNFSNIAILITKQRSVTMRQPGLYRNIIVYSK